MALLKEKYLLPIGVICLAIALLIDRFLPVDSVTSFIVGMLSGMSVVLNMAGIYKAGKRV